MEVDIKAMNLYKIKFMNGSTKYAVSNNIETLASYIEEENIKSIKKEDEVPVIIPVEDLKDNH